MKKVFRVLTAFLLVLAVCGMSWPVAVPVSAASQVRTLWNFSSGSQTLIDFEDATRGTTAFDTGHQVIINDSTDDGDISPRPYISIVEVDRYPDKIKFTVTGSGFNNNDFLDVCLDTDMNQSTGGGFQDIGYDYWVYGHWDDQGVFSGSVNNWTGSGFVVTFDSTVDSQLSFSLPYAALNNSNGDMYVVVAIGDSDYSDYAPDSGHGTTVQSATETNQGPIVSKIPDIVLDQRGYTEFNLDQYVTDTKFNKNLINWNKSGEVHLNVYITTTSDNTGRIAQGALIDASQTDWTGEETLTFTATDPDGLSASGTVKVTVNPVVPGNHAPVANVDAYTTFMNTTLIIDSPGVLANDTDADGDTLAVDSYSITGLQGSLTMQNNIFTFTPTTGWTGTTSFTYRVTDSHQGVSGWTTVTIIVQSATETNQGPIVSKIPDIVLDQRGYTEFNLDQYVTDTKFNKNLINWNKSGEVHLNVYITTTSDSTGRIAQGALIDASQTDWTGEETLTFTATDPDGLSASGTVKVTVNPVVPGNHAPVANVDAYTTFMNTPLIMDSPGVLANDTDADGDTLAVDSYSITGLQGSLTMQNNIFTFTPTAGWTGTTSFTYRVTDSHQGVSGWTTVTIIVQSVTETNQGPIVSKIPDIVLDQGQSVEFNLDQYVTDAKYDDNHVNWTKSDTKHVAVYITTTSDSTGRIAQGALINASSMQWSGVENVTFTVTDPDGLSASDTISVTVNPVIPVNHAPVANVDAYTTFMNTPLIMDSPGVLANDTDVDGDTLGVDSFNATALRGSLTMQNNIFTFTPTAGWTGTTSFTYLVTDYHQGVSGWTTVTIIVQSLPVVELTVNENVAVSDAVQVLPPVLLSITESVTVADIIQVLPSISLIVNETITAVDSLKVLPPVSLNVNEHVVVSDGPQLSPPATAHNQVVTVNWNSSIQIVLSAENGNGSSLTYAIVARPAHGTLTGTIPNLTYTPSGSYTGPDSFTFKASDALSTSNIATVSIVITATTAHVTLGTDSLSNLVNIPSNSHVIVSTQPAESDVTFPEGTWIVYLKTDADWKGQCQVQIGGYNPRTKVFYPFNTVLTDPYINGTLIITLEQTGTSTLYSGDSLVAEITNNDVIGHDIITDGSSYLTVPQDALTYPVPEMPTLALLGLGLAGIGGYLVISNKQSKKKSII